MILFDPLETPRGSRGGWGEEGEDLGFVGSEAYSIKKQDEVTIFCKNHIPHENIASAVKEPARARVSEAYYS